MNRKNIKSYDPIHPDPPVDPGGTTDTGFTTNYKLLLCHHDTITSWLTMFNENMEKLDDIMHALELRTSIDGEVPPQAIEDIIKLNEDMVTAKEQISTIENTIHQIEEQLVNLQTMYADVSILKQNFVNLDTSVTALNTIATAHTQSIQKLDANYTTLEERVSGNVDRLDEQEGQLDTLTVRISTVENNYTSLEARVAALEAGG